MSAPLHDAYVDANTVAERARKVYLDAKLALLEAETAYDRAKEVRNAAATNRSLAYSLYADACVAEACEAHTFNMWTIHGEPQGPLG